MKPNTIEEQIEEVLIAWLKSGNENTTKASFLIAEVCKRYAIEVAKASLEKASENAEIDDPSTWGPSATIIKETITSEDNIVL